MTVIVPKKKTSNKQPASPSLSINWSNPLTKGLVYAYTPLSRISETSGLSPITTLDSDANIVTTSQGLGLNCTKASFYDPIGATVQNPKLCKSTFILMYRPTSGSFGATHQLVPNVKINSTTNVVQIKYADQDTILLTGTIPTVPGFFGCIHTFYRAGGTNANIYVNGVLDIEGLIPNYTPGLLSRIGSVQGQGHFDYINLLVLGWDRGTEDLTPEEKKSLAENPWQLFAPRRQLLYVSATSVQLSYLRPAFDITTGSWSPSTGTTLYGVLDEVTADDADYIQASTATGCEVKLSAGSTPTSRDNHTIKYRLLAGSGNIAVVLKCGSTTIKSWNHVLTGSAQDFSQALSNAEATNITDYSDLRVTFTSS
jgi:hypothetical protein